MKLSLLLSIIGLIAVSAHETGVTVTKCGYTAKSWQNWYGTLTTRAPVIYPNNDAELATAISTAAAHGCSARVAGTGHSKDGHIVQRDEDNVLVISMAEYTPASNWDGIVDLSGKTVKMGAGYVLFIY